MARRRMPWNAATTGETAVLALAIDRTEHVLHVHHHIPQVDGDCRATEADATVLAAYRLDVPLDAKLCTILTTWLREMPKVSATSVMVDRRSPG